MVIRLQARSRRGKWELYQQRFAPQRGERVLDLGASALDDLPGENYFLRCYPYPDQLTAVGIEDLDGLRQRYPGVTFITADGRDLPFPDESFDVVHSNAVVEHVGDHEDQKRFVAELVRVGRAGFVTTPNRWFPVETHSKLPLLHWLPRPIVFRLARVLNQPDLRWRLLGEREFRALFPAVVQLQMDSTRLLGLRLTLIAVYGRPESSSPTRGGDEA